MEATTTAGTPLTFSGTVTGLTCGRVAGARVDVWQPDPAGVYDMTGFGLRGHQLTDGQGRFQFRTVMPGPPGRRAPHLGVNVTVKGKADFWTELFFPDEPRNASDARFHPDLVVKLVPDGRTRRAHFDIVLDI
jgi:protocatechuate 3,4-dioxygenase beta subunit